MAETARRAFVAALVFVAVVALALALWKMRLLIALLFLALVVAAAMRPGVDWLKRRGVPRAVGVCVHYLAFAGLFALLLWLVVPRALDQIGRALGGDVPTSQEELRDATKRTSGVAHSVLLHVQNAARGPARAGRPDRPRAALDAARARDRSSASSSRSRRRPTGSSSATA